MSNKAVFLDLQGTLGGDGLGDIMDFEFFPYSIEAIKLLNYNNILAIVVTNQSHIAKGMLTMTDFNNRVEELKAELSSKKAHIHAVYCCPHGRNDNCNAILVNMNTVHKFNAEGKIHFTMLLDPTTQLGRVMRRRLKEKSFYVFHNKETAIMQ